MTTYPSCPDCGVLLVDDDCYDTDSGLESYYEKHYGHCPRCTKVFNWVAVFNLSHITNLEECS